MDLQNLQSLGDGDLRFSFALLPGATPGNEPIPTIIVVQVSYCSFCLRERPLDGAFYGYNIENCPIIRETMEDIFGPKFKLEKFSICTPCWNMIQLMDGFRTCCFEANRCSERIKSGLKSEDGWYSQDTLQRIEVMHSAIRDQIERIKTRAAEDTHKPNSTNEVITIDDDSDDDRDSTNLEIVEQPLEEPQSTLPDCQENAMIVLPVIQNSIIETSTPTIEQVSEEQSFDHANGIETSTPQEIPTYSIKLEVEEPEDDNYEEYSTPLVLEEQRSLLPDRADNFVEENAAEPIPELPEIPTLNIKTEVMLPEEEEEVEFASQDAAQEDHVEAHEATVCDNLFTEISVENIKVEKDEVREKIAKLVNARVSQCGKCGYTYTGCTGKKIHKRGIINHMEQCKNQDAVEPGMMYTCQICWASYRSKTNFKAHLNQHIDHKPYKCRLQCSKHFYGLRGRIKHEEKCNAAICCGVCERSFSDKESLFTHIKSAHGKLAFQCSICDVRIPTRAGLRRHSLSLHRERDGGFPCRRCKKHIANTAHEASLHLKECRMNFTFDCDQCDARLRNASTLKTHKAAYHDEPKYCCNVCGKKYKHKFNAMHHQATHANPDVKPKIPCTLCHKKFSSSANLNRHMNVHISGPIYPFPCSFCGRRFSSKQAMQTHVKSVCKKVAEFDS